MSAWKYRLSYGLDPETDAVAIDYVQALDLDFILRAIETGCAVTIQKL